MVFVVKIGFVWVCLGCFGFVWDVLGCFEFVFGVKIRLGGVNCFEKKEFLVRLGEIYLKRMFEKTFLIWDVWILESMLYQIENC